jgi:hypothetical protein
MYYAGKFLMSDSGACNTRLKIRRLRLEMSVRYELGYFISRDGSDGIANRYGLDSLEIEPADPGARAKE